MSKTGPSGYGHDSTAEEVTEGVDLSGQTWLVTGCNSGLGLETARVLALRGAHVIGAARSKEKAAAAVGPFGGTAVACELSDPSSVRAAVEQVSAGPPLHGIVANAGIMAVQTLEQVHGVERQFFVNHVGHFILINGLVGRLEKKGRVVVLSSGAHRMAKEQGLELDNLSGERDYHPWRMYGRSKLANIQFARSLGKRLDGGRTANALHPGVIETELGRHIPDREAMYARMKKLKSIPQGAATQCYVATAPSLAGKTGRYFSDCNMTSPVPVALDDAQGAALWDATERLVGEL